MNRKFLTVASAVFTLSFGVLFSTYADPITPVEDARPSVVTPQTVSQATGYDNQSADEAPASGNAFLLQKIQALQEQLQVLQGTIEVQAHDLKMLNQQQRALYNDIDQRLIKLNRQSRVAAAAGEAKVAATPDQEKTEEITSANVEQPTINDRQAYQAAYELIKNKQFKLAEIALRTFIETFPNSDYSANSHYWLGELLLNQGMLDDAMKHFDAVITKYPHSNKLSAAMLKMGYVYYDKGMWKQARNELNKVHDKFPDTVSSKLALHRLREMDKHGL